MAGKIQVVNVDDVEALEEQGVMVRFLVSKAMGSEKIDFVQTVLPVGAEGASLYENQDEVFFVLSGEAEVEIEGRRRKVQKGSCVFVPAGCAYSYRVTQAPNEVVAAFSPARDG